MTDDTEFLLHKRAKDLLAPKSQTLMASDARAGGKIIHAGTNQAFEKFGTFIVCSLPCLKGPSDEHAC